MMDIFDITAKSEQMKIISTKIAPTSIRTDDRIFTKYRNFHIYEAFRNIDNDLKNFIETSDVAKFHKKEEEY